eukprot:Selendium_serpulae@DN10264_c0_g1_i1.p1
MNSRVADITVVCGDATRVPASSFLLCARSPVIRHLLVTNPDNDEIVLDEEVPSRVIKEFVAYCHFDKCELLLNRPIDLLDLSILCMMANTYNFEGLLHATLSEIIRSISADTILPISDIAASINSKALNDAIAAFLSNSKVSREIGGRSRRAASVRRGASSSSRQLDSRSFSGSESFDTRSFSRSTEDDTVLSRDSADSFDD